MDSNILSGYLDNMDICFSPSVKQKLAQILSLNHMQTVSKQLSIKSMHGLYNWFKHIWHLRLKFGSALDLYSCEVLGLIPT